MIDSLISKALSVAYELLASRSMVPVFTFHHVLPELTPMTRGAIDADSFDALVCLLSKHYNVASLPEVIDQYQSNKVSPRTVAITFDDGFQNNYTIALPILKKYKVSATFFLTTGYVDDGWMWNNGVFHAVGNTEKQILDLSFVGLGACPVNRVDQRQQLILRIIETLKYLPPNKRMDSVLRLLDLTQVGEPTGLMMNEEQIKGLSDSGMTIGGHTVSHPILSRISDKEAFQEIAGNKSHLEAIIGKKIDCFAYPNGKPGKDYTRTHVKLLKDLGFKGAVSTEARIAAVPVDMFQIPRYTPWDHNMIKFQVRLIRQVAYERFGLPG